MALNAKTSVTNRNLALDAALPSALNAGHFLVYDSTQPTDADTALGAQVLLADLSLNATAFAAASSGSKAANAITQDSSANATGTAAWMTIVASSRATTGTMDGSVGTGTHNFVVNSVAFSSGAAVSCSSFTATMAA